MATLGREAQSLRYWDDIGRSYSAALENDYHAHRLHVIRALIPEELLARGRRVFDFGCGDAVLFSWFLEQGADILGVDISPEMIALAKARLAKEAARAAVGDVSALEKLETGSLDGLLSFNVLAYLTDAEERLFYREAARVVKTGGHLIVTHSNELFDLFSLNRYTIEFFQKHLVADPDLRSKLPTALAFSDQPSERTTYNVRESPLSYGYKLARFGFREEQQEFINLHPAPPALLGARTYVNTLGVPEEERWKLMFVCSTYGSRSVRMGL